VRPGADFDDRLLPARSKVDWQTTTGDSAMRSRMKSTAWLVGVAAVVTAFSGCAAIEPVASEHYADPSAFEDASPLKGTTVAVRGYLVWEFENKNLYPSKAAMDTRHCLPLLVHRDRKDLLAKLEAASGKFVVVRGKVAAAAPPGMMSVGACKQIGLEVDSLDAD
jgi:hypothetical protein